MQIKFLVAAVSLALCGATFAAEPAPAKPAPKPAYKRSLAPRTASQGGEDVLGRAVYQALLGDFALREGDLELAASAWGDLALRTRDPQVLARAIEVLGFARKYDMATELADLWVQLEPESVKARQARSALAVQASRLDELAPQISALLAQDAQALPANLLHLNRLLSRHTDKNAVQKLVDRVTQPYAHLPEARYTMAQAAANAGDDLRAQQEISQALLLRSDWDQAAVLRAQIMARQGNRPAIEGLQAFLGAHPEAREARLTLARLLITEKRYDESRLQFERLLQGAPDSHELLYPLAMLSLQQGDAAQSRRLLQRLLETDFPDKSAVHYFLGQLDEEAKQSEAALAHYAQVQSGEQYLTARTRAALLLQKQGQVDEARTLLQRSTAATPVEQVQLLLAESLLLREANRTEEAWQLLEASLLKHPDNPELLYEAALMAERQGKPEVLEKHLERLLKLKPDHAHALNALAYSWAERNIRLKEAEKLVAKALRLAPGDAYIMDSQGWVFFRQGRLKESLAVLQKAYEIKRDGEIAAHLGELLWQMERKDEARRILLEAAREHPDNDVLSALIKKLLP